MLERLIEKTKKFHEIIEERKKNTEEKIIQMKNEAIRDIKNISIKISIEAVENIMKNSIDKKKIEMFFPHREPMLLIDKLINIVPLKSATAIVKVRKNSCFVQGHFPGQPVMPGVIIVEAFGQAAAALTAYSLNPKEVENK